MEKRTKPGAAPTPHPFPSRSARPGSPLVAGSNDPGPSGAQCESTPPGKIVGPSDGSNSQPWFAGSSGRCPGTGILPDSWRWGARSEISSTSSSTWPKSSGRVGPASPEQFRNFKQRRAFRDGELAIVDQALVQAFGDLGNGQRLPEQIFPRLERLRPLQGLDVGQEQVAVADDAFRLQLPGDGRRGRAGSDPQKASRARRSSSAGATRQ